MYLPKKPKKPCASPRCPNLTTEQYCDTHKKQEAKRYEQVRGTAARRGYDYRWAKYSKLFRRHNPLCVHCLEQGRLTPSEHTDHIEAVDGPDDPKFWYPNNHQALCQPCHSRKTVREDGGLGR